MTSASVEYPSCPRAAPDAARLSIAEARRAGGRVGRSVRTRAGIIWVNPHAIATALMRRRPDLILSAGPALTGWKVRA